MNVEKQAGPACAEKVIDGIRYRKVPTGYTIREYFSHFTEGKGPGPGWDFRWSVLEEYGIHDGDPSKLPDEPLYDWIPADELPD